MAKIGLSGLWAEGGELGAVESDHIFAAGMFVDKRLEQVGIIVCGVDGALIPQQRHAFKFFSVSHCSHKIVGSPAVRRVYLAKLHFF